MSYSAEQEKFYGCYSHIEDVSKAMDSLDYQDALRHLDIHSNTLHHILSGDCCSDAFVRRQDGSDLEVIDDPSLSEICNRPRAFILLTYAEGHKFFDLSSSIHDRQYKVTDPLPEEFFHALNNGLIVKQELTKDRRWKKTPYDGLKGLNLKTYADLPEDFIEGIRNKTIGFEVSHDVNLMKKDHARTISLICKSMTSKPLTLLIHGAHRFHSASYIARISEDNTCEIIGLNSLPNYNDQYFFDVLKEGIQQGYESNKISFAEPVLKIIKQKNWSCSAISACVLSQVDPDKTLSDQFDHLCAVMTGVINNAQMARRLFARMEWWYRTIYYSLFETKLKQDPDHAIGMKKIFNQLFYFTIKLDPPQKIDFPEEEQFREDYLKFLNVFCIKINDQKFLSLFNKVDYVPVEEVTELKQEKSTSGEESSELEQEHSIWYENPKNIVEKLLDDVEEAGESKKVLFQAMQDLATHAKKHLLSSATSDRAKAGMTKLNKLDELLSEENLKNLHTFKAKIGEILNVRKPQKSDLLKNRGGFFGIYKTYSQIAAKMGSPHFTYKNRTAISSTDHYLIALFHAVSDILSSESNHSMDSSQSK